MDNASHRDTPLTHNAALVERVVLLRTALTGLTNDHTTLHRKLSRVRAENAALRARLQMSDQTAVTEAGSR